ncbi:hypothetical protein V9K67_21375 [Paraflavisolibacter sp. H34]|uniref:hypothetical protein n=1 Tax=Huijunlia imazamoxiresistens TaxID=3127457 RepID=UPI00301AF00F
MIYVAFPKLLYRSDFLSQIFLVVSIVLVILFLPHMFISWVKKKHLLYEPENYFVLILFAVFTAVIFGVMSFSLQSIDTSTYTIDPVLIEKEQIAYREKNEKSLQEARITLQKVKNVYDYINYHKAQPLQLVEKRAPWYSFTQSYFYRLAQVDIKFSKTEGSSRGVISIAYYMEFTLGKDQVEIIALEKIISYKHFPLKLDENAVPILLSYLEKHMKWIADNQVHQHLGDIANMESKKFSPSIDKYLYDSIMHMLGNSTGYFKPYSFYGRIIEVLKTLFKFFYVSYFVSFLVKRFSIKQ